MRRIVLWLLLVTLFVGSSVDAQQKRRKRTRSITASASSGNVTNITQCPDEGIGGDPNLNRRKNIRSDNKRSTLRTLQWMKNLADPTGFTRQNTSRSRLAKLGEGQKVSVVAYALVARKGGKESCNCKLSAPKDTDNHIVLVDPALRRPTLANSEPDSETAEFTPRVRLDHPNLSRPKLQPLIDGQGGKLLVRVTGLLLFDSEHFLGNHLKRHNNWEIHPVLKMEYCPEGQTCSSNSNDSWRSLESR
jgi:hypothetical protein